MKMVAGIDVEENEICQWIYHKRIHRVKLVDPTNDNALTSDGNMHQMNYKDNKGNC